MSDLRQPGRCPIATQHKTRAQKKTEPTVSSEEFARQIAKLAAETRCSGVVLLDVRGLSPITDYMIIGTGTSDRQMKAVADEIEEIGQPLGERVHHRSIDAEWILLDYVDIVVHLFSQEARVFYDLESLWGDAKTINWK